MKKYPKGTIFINKTTNIKCKLDTCFKQWYLLMGIETGRPLVINESELFENFYTIDEVIDQKLKEGGG
jgi:hypothetical protein